MCHCTHFAEPTLPYQSFRRPFKPAASLWHWLFYSWEQQVFIAFGISRLLAVACLTFNSADSCQGCVKSLFDLRHQLGTLV